MLHGSLDGAQEAATDLIMPPHYDEDDEVPLANAQIPLIVTGIPPKAPTAALAPPQDAGTDSELPSLPTSRLPSGHGTPARPRHITSLHTHVQDSPSVTLGRAVGRLANHASSATSTPSSARRRSTSRPPSPPPLRLNDDEYMASKMPAKLPAAPQVSHTGRVVRKTTRYGEEEQEGDETRAAKGEVAIHLLSDDGQQEPNGPRPVASRELDSLNNLIKAVRQVAGEDDEKMVGPRQSILSPLPLLLFVAIHL